MNSKLQKGSLLLLTLVKNTSGTGDFIMKITDADQTTDKVKLVCVLKSEPFFKKENNLVLRKQVWTANITSNEVEGTLTNEDLIVIGNQGLKFSYEFLTVDEMRRISVHLI